MHELSIAMSMIEMAEAEAIARGGRVTALHLKLGPLSGVVRDALEFSWAIACEGTLLEGSELVIEEVPVQVHCFKCDADEFAVSFQDLRCPRCGQLSADVVQGRELEVVALELEAAEEMVS
jgi:hydrogenase nickel incorporation protein HypA/HybF